MDCNRLFYMNIIYKCNNRCVNCISASTKHNLIEVNKPFSIIKNFDSKFNYSKNDTFIVCGGEPTLSSDFTNIIEYLKSKECKIVVYSNGRTLKNYLDFCSYPVRWIIPVYGDKSAHSFYSGSEIAYKETIDSLVSVPRELRKNISIKFIINEMNQISGISNFINEFGNDFLEYNITFMIKRKNIKERMTLALEISDFIGELINSEYRIKISNCPLCCLSDSLKKWIMEHRDKSLDRCFETFYFFNNDKLEIKKDVSINWLEYCNTCEYNELCVENCLKYLVIEDCKSYMGIE